MFTVTFSLIHSIWQRVFGSYATRLQSFYRTTDDGRVDYVCPMPTAAAETRAIVEHLVAAFKGEDDSQIDCQTVIDSVVLDWIHSILKKAVIESGNIIDPREAVKLSLQVACEHGLEAGVKQLESITDPKSDRGKAARKALEASFAKFEEMRKAQDQLLADLI